MQIAESTSQSLTSVFQWIGVDQPRYGMCLVADIKVPESFVSAVSAVCKGAVSPGPKVDQSAALKTMCGMQWGKEPYKMAICSRYNVQKIAEGVNTRDLGPIRSGAKCPT